MSISNKYKAFPFWSWNDELDEKELVRQIDWMHDNGIGGFFMHARGGLTTPYLGEKWFSCVEACLKRAKELDMEAYAYDENGWPSGFVGGKLLDDPENHDMYVISSIGEFDPNADVSYDFSGTTLVRVNKGNNVLNLYLKNSACTADVCSKKVVDKFISMTHEEYKKNDTFGNLRGFFTDEPQYYRWSTAYTRILPNYFKEQYDEDLFDKLGLLFVEKEGYREFRYKYWKSMQSLMLNNFAKNIYDWCQKNNYKLTGHYCEENFLEGQMWCCAGVMPFYEYENIPGIDYLQRNLVRSAGPRQMGSVASQLGKDQRMAEIFACAGWDATPNELKLIAEYAMVGGVNILCPHLLPYSEHGQRKRDYPEHYSTVNPWVKKDFKTFNDYFAVLGEKLAKSKEIANVGVLHPMRSTYAIYKFDDPCRGLGEIDKLFKEDNLTLEKMHLPFHYLDETIMAKHAKVVGNSLMVGECKYDYIVIPRCVFDMDKSTEELLSLFAKNGGKVLLMGDKPQYVEGKEHDFSYLGSNVTFEEIINNQEMIMEQSDDVVCSYHLDEEGTPYIYALNCGKTCNVKVRRNGFKNVKIGEKVYESNLSFKEYESKVIYFTNDNVDELDNKKIIKLGSEFEVSKTDKNYIILDFVSMSKDNKNYSNKCLYMGLFDKLLRERYQGTLYLKYDVNIKTVPSKCNALIEDTRTKNVFVNGIKVEKCGTVLEKDLWKFDIVKCLKKGINEIVVEIDFFESEDVYYALFGENVTESLKNCLAYDTTIEAIYLEGDFGVFGDLKEVDGCYVGNEFYLDSQKGKTSTLIEDGFPFFRGDIKLTQYIDVKDANSKLLIDKRFQMIDVFINDNFVERLMFNNECDISRFAKQGKNKIDLVITISNRNLLGPHHSHSLEELGVGPYSFELFGTWDENGESKAAPKRYSFVKIL